MHTYREYITMEQLLQSFSGGGSGGLEGQMLHEGVAQLLQQAPNEKGTSAISEALGALGAEGFGQSVAQGAAHTNPQQHSALASLLLQAVEQGGGNKQQAQRHLGSGGAVGSAGLGNLAQFVAGNHGNALAGVLGSQLSGPQGGSGLMSMLGSPMARQIGMSLAKKLL
jgi:hypothetical protein